MKLDLMHLNRIIGTLEILSDARLLKASRTADGLTLWLTAEIHFPHDNRPNVLNGYANALRVTLFQDGVEVGVGDDPLYHWGQGDTRFEVGVRLTTSTLAAIERRRNARGLAIRAHVQVQSGVVLNHNDTSGMLTRPVIRSGDFDLEFDRDHWVSLIRSTGWGENIIAEVALPPTPAPPWDAIWQSLRIARDALDRGGPVAWKACVTECREALEAWRSIESIDTGPAGAAPRTLTRAQRFDVLREGLHRFAHEAVHSRAGDTTRSEAVMVLASLAGLLGDRSNR
jgi:hypothetical protein